MSQLLGLSFDAPASPEISFSAADIDDAERASGWGVAWYPAGELAALSLRDPFNADSASLASSLHDWDRFRTVMVLAHLRGAAKRRAHRDTQPFLRILGGRTWSIAHAGDLGPDYESGLSLPPGPQFTSTGTTDTEHLFTWLLAEAAHRGASSLAELGYDVLHELLERANRYGTLNVILGDGTDLVAYQDQGGHEPLWWHRSVPPASSRPLHAAGISVINSGWTDAYRTMVVVASMPFGTQGWSSLTPGQLLVIRRGSVIFSAEAPELASAPSGDPAGAESDESHDADGVGRDAPEHTASTSTAPADEDDTAAADAQDDDVPDEPGPPGTPAPTVAPSTRPSTIPSGTSGARRRLLEVVHETTYTYDQPVERSSHSLRLTPVADEFQHVRRHELEVAAAGNRYRFEDVFGNIVTGFEVSEPFDELRIRARSLVEVIELVDRPHLLPVPPMLPLVWMPWQRQMMHAYLMPPELPESQLQELGVFAQSFAERNRQDLLAALDDLNLTIHRDFLYQSGFTTLETTPFEVYVNRAGVCQDFANLMICLARLLGIPARYRVGYIFTGTDYENTIQSEASHAWVELYLPQLGWRGYDPTNGVRAGRDHIRVACGRNYRDATPTGGVIHRGGGGERLTTRVRVEEQALL